MHSPVVLSQITIQRTDEYSSGLKVYHSAYTDAYSIALFSENTIQLTLMNNPLLFFQRTPFSFH